MSPVAGFRLPGAYQVAVTGYKFQVTGIQYQAHACLQAALNESRQPGNW